MPDLDAIHRDLMYLAGRLLHRSAQTGGERQAAEYIAGRLRAYAPDVEIDTHASIENPLYLFASYLGEFAVVATLAIWWPVFALLYGAAVCIAFLAEFAGYRLFSRFLPAYESQNVIARFLGARPRALIVVNAHYDSGSPSPLTAPAMLPWLRWGLIAAAAAMLAVCAACALDLWGLYTAREYPIAAPLRWGACAALIAAAAFLFYASTQGDDIRGANHNASGVAALLQIAQRLAAQPIDQADVWLVATGSHQQWMGGMHHLITAHRPPKDTTLLLNLECVGCGGLRYLVREGMMLPLKADPALAAAAAAEAPRFAAAPAAMHGVPTALHIPLHRGYRGMTLMALGERGLPLHWNAVDGRITEIDEETIARAAEFAEAILRRIDAALA